MARLIFSVEHRGLDECLACFSSIAETADCARRDAELIEIECSEGIAKFQGMELSTIDAVTEGCKVTVMIRPTASIILFAGWFMSVLPRRATVVWKDGWPLFHCPPNDDRDGEEEPTPLVPSELIPA